MLRPSLRVLDPRDLEEALVLCARDVVANLFVAARLRETGVDGGGQLWGFYEGSQLTSLCWWGANLVPVEATPAAVDAFAARARRIGRRCSSIVGPAEPVLALWRQLSGTWARPREVRSVQPLMALSGPPAVPADPAVRRGRPEELDLIVPACVSMFTEEVGYSPVAVDGGAAYVAQVTGLVTQQRSFVRVEQGEHGPEIVFKAELGSVTPEAVQVQGVWVNPAHRGRGLAAPAMAALVEQVRASVAPTVSLYVNDFNHRAVRVYERVGFARVGTYATVLF
ncbi:MAG: GNAT family N-acetyltransferase [Kineosporiaceae bacterium]